MSVRSRYWKLIGGLRRAANRRAAFAGSPRSRERLKAGPGQQAAQDLVWSGAERLWRRRLRSLPGQLGLVFDRPHGALWRDRCPPPISPVKNRSLVLMVK